MKGWLPTVMAAAALFSMAITGCDSGGGGGEDGTITVTLTGAGAAEGDDFLFAVFAAGADIDVDDPLGMGVETITGGVASGPAMDINTGTVVVSFSGDDNYDVYALVDANGNMDVDPGELLGSQTGVAVDGNITVTFAYASLVPSP